MVRTMPHSMIRYSVAVCALLLAASPCLADDGDAPAGTKQFQEVNELRVSGKYEQAITILRTLLADPHPEAVLRRGYSELVFTLLQKGQESEAAAVVDEGLRRFPDLTADIVLFPPTVNELYEKHRKGLFGAVVLRTTPPDCAVWIDGEVQTDVVSTQQFLSAGNHELIVRKQGHNDVSLSFPVRADQETLIDVTLQPLGSFTARRRLRAGFDIGLSLVQMDFDGSAAPGGRATDGEGDTQYSFGLFAEFGIKPRLFVQPGLRVVRIGGTTNYEQPSFVQPLTPQPLTSARADVRLDYLSASLLLKRYPFRTRGLFLSVGPEFARILRARLSPSDLEPRSAFDLTTMDPSLDISDNLKSYNIALNGGLGYEFPVAENFVFVNFLYSYGLVNTGKDDRSEFGWRTRELKISAGFVY